MAKEGTEVGVWAAKEPAAKDLLWWLQGHCLMTKPRFLEESDPGFQNSDDSLTQIHPLGFSQDGL